MRGIPDELSRGACTDCGEEFAIDADSTRDDSGVAMPDRTRIRKTASVFDLPTAVHVLRAPTNCGKEPLRHFPTPRHHSHFMGNNLPKPYNLEASGPKIPVLNLRRGSSHNDDANIPSAATRTIV